MGSKYQPYRQGANIMALSVQFVKYLNQLINEDIVVPRLVNQQSLNFNALCDYLADGSTVTAADVAAVMKQIENRLPLILALNAKVECSPEGLTFRPKVSGSITQSQLKKKLQAKLAADPTLDIDVNRALQTSDLAVSDLTAEIAIELPKVWTERFQQKTTFKRVNKALAETTDDTPSGSGPNTNDTNGTNGGSTSSGSGGSNTNPSNGTNSETVASPTISGSTSFSETTSVTMSAEAGAEIRYTTDGSTPTASSTLYASALTLSDTTTVKAIAIKDGVSSEVTTKTFTKSSGAGDDAE